MTKILLNAFLALGTSLALNADVLRVKSDATGTGDGSTWADAFPKLQDAIAAAISGDTIWVAAGVHYPDEGAGQTDNARVSSFTIDKNLSLYGGFEGTENVLLARDPFTHVTVLSGDLEQNDTGKDANGVLTDPDLISGDNSHHVVSVVGTDTDALVSGFTLTGGLHEEDGVGGADESARGGGIYVHFAKSLNLDLCNLQGNMSLEGAGIHINGTEATVANCKIQSNSALNRGGGIHRGGGGPVSFINCVIAGNYGVRGGGAYHLATATTTYTNCTIHGNQGTSDLGNGIYDEGGTTSVINSIVWNSFSSDNPLDEINNNGTSTIIFSHSLVQHHDLSGSGSNLDGADDANDPLFLVPLIHNQSPQLWSDFRQASNSPVNDAGDNSANSYIVDFLLKARVFNNIIDLGAVEYHPTVWYVNHNASGANDGTTWTNAFDDLQDALAAAINGDEIWIAAGIYRPGDGSNRGAMFLINKTISVYGGFDGTETDREARDPFANRVVLSGDLDQNDTTNGLGIVTDPANLTGDNAYTVCKIGVVADGGYNTDPVLLTGVTITGGLGGSGGGALSVISVSDSIVSFCPMRGNSATSGGALSFNDLNSSKLHLEDCTIRDNTASFAGGGASFSMNETDSDNASATVTRCTFVANTTEGDGGAITHSKALRIVDSTFTDNTADDQGGGVYSNFSSEILVEGSSFSSNSADTGGALLVRDNARVNGSSFNENTSTEGGAILSDEALVVTDSTFTGNEATSGGLGGGAIVAPNATISGSTFTSNISAVTSGAIRLSSGSSSITNCGFYGNESATGGGGLYVINGSLDLTNCAFGGNESSSGGGLYIYTSASCTVTNASFQGNSGTLGGGIHCFGSTVDLANIVAWGNASNGDPQDASASIYADPSSTVTYTYCLLDNLNPAGTGNLNGTLNSNDPDFVTSTSPLLAPAVGGDLRLQSGSPAINRGLNSANGSTFDLDGNLRVFDTTIDLGAYEFGSTGLVTFSSLFPSLSPDGDENGNGLTNYADYAVGADPTLPLGASDQATIDGTLVMFPARSNASDVFVTWEKSTTLLPGSWSDLEEGTDYTLIDTVNTGAQAVTTLDLMLSPPATPSLFIRQSFSPMPPASP